MAYPDAGWFGSWTDVLNEAHAGAAVSGFDWFCRAVKGGSDARAQDWLDPR